MFASFFTRTRGVCHGINMSMCAKVKTPYVGDGRPTFNTNPCNAIGLVSNIFLFTPTRENDPIGLIFFRWVVQPPTSI